MEKYAQQFSKSLMIVNDLCLYNFNENSFSNYKILPFSTLYY